MNSRIETLLKTFLLEDRYYKGMIEKSTLNIDYTETNKILKREQERFENFLDKIFNG